MPDLGSDLSSASQSAAEWVARRDRGLSAEEKVAFAAWQAADPRNRSELERIQRTWRRLDAAGSVNDLTALAEFYHGRARRRGAQRRVLRFIAAGLAAAAAIAIGVFSWAGLPLRNGSRPGAAENYRVLASTIQRMDLPDGSVAELNGDSRIELDFISTERRVRLIEGEAHFIVAKNPARPFFVTAGPVTVRAVGTAFNVRLASATIEVLVTEGEVKLEAAEAAAASARDDEVVGRVEETSGLVKGQRAVIDLNDSAANVAIGDVGAAEIDDALGWQSTRLVFNNTPLDEVVAGFNRYNVRRLVLGDSRLRQRTVTGIFRADNLEGFVRLLRPLIDVTAELRTPGETVLMPAK
jgi:transmembrane sensor